MYDENDTEKIVRRLLENGQTVSEAERHKVGLEEYYINLMTQREGA